MYITCSVVCELLPRGLQVFFGRSLDTLADLFRGHVSNVGVAVYNVLVLLLGVVFVVLSVIYSKRALKRVEEEELAREAAEAEALAMEGGLPPTPTHEGGAATATAAAGAAAAAAGGLPGKVAGKLTALDSGAGEGCAVGATAAHSPSPTRTSSGDLRVLVVEEEAAAAVAAAGGQQWDAGARSGISNGRAGSALIPVGILPAAASGSRDGDSSFGAGSQCPSTLSLRSLLGFRFSLNRTKSSGNVSSNSGR